MRFPSHAAVWKVRTSVIMHRAQPMGLPEVEGELQAILINGEQYSGGMLHRARVFRACVEALSAWPPRND